MKKILGISLCALFAVSAANANIASQEWVEQQIEGIDTTLEGLGDLATKDAVTAAEITDGAVTSTKINDGAVTEAKLGASAVTTAKIANGAVTTTQIAGNTITDANIATGAGILSSKIAFDTDEEAALNSGITATLVGQIETAVQDVTTGSSNGTISVDGTDVAVKGLGTAAYTASTAYAPATLTGTVSTNTSNIAANAEDIAALQGSVGGLGALAHESTVTTNFITDGTIMNADINNDAQIAPTKINFSTEQAGALNSGITSSKVTQIGTNATAIDGINRSMNTLSGTVSTNTGNIAANAEDIAALQGSVTGLGALAHESTVTTNFITDGTIMNADISDTAKIAMNKIDFSSEQTGALDSGIDSVKVGQIATNTGNITANKNSIEAIQDYLTGMVERAPGYTDCKNSGEGCTLVLDAEGFKWEAVTREAQ